MPLTAGAGGEGPAQSGAPPTQTGPPVGGEMSQSSQYPDSVGYSKTLFVRNNYATSTVEVAIAFFYDQLLSPESLHYLHVEQPFPALSELTQSRLLRIRNARMAAPVFGPSRVIFSLSMAARGRRMPFPMPQWLRQNAAEAARRIGE